MHPSSSHDVRQDDSSPMVHSSTLEQLQTYDFRLRLLLHFYETGALQNEIPFNVTFIPISESDASDALLTHSQKRGAILDTCQ